MIIVFKIINISTEETDSIKRGELRETKFPNMISNLLLTSLLIFLLGEKAFSSAMTNLNELRLTQETLSSLPLSGDENSPLLPTNGKSSWTLPYEQNLKKALFYSTTKGADENSVRTYLQQFNISRYLQALGVGRDTGELESSSSSPK